ncbi:hypothetical protein BX600DRAFT_429948 [Xylariales sp. PMI_506]|nr:hypothetical protein BX600DRAFT_429948 [Xylariales sp. PMI_506]
MDYSYDIEETSREEESVGLLPADPSFITHTRERTKFQTSHIIALYSSNILLIVTAMTLWLMPRTCQDPGLAQWSPANEFVEYIDHHHFRAALLNRTEYMGYPTADGKTVRLWGDLYNYGISRISHEEAKNLPSPTLAIPGTQDYLVQLDVFHELHCLNDLRKALYPDVYGELKDKHQEFDGVSGEFNESDHDEFHNHLPDSQERTSNLDGFGWSQQQRFLGVGSQWLLILSISIAAASTMVVVVLQSSLDHACLKYMEPWSPFFVSTEYETRKYDWDICPEEYCGDIKPDRESAWSRLWDYGWVGFPRSMVSSLDKSSQKDWLHSLGAENNNSLISLPEFVHQIHCISMIRNSIYGVKEHHAGFGEDIEDAALQLHVDHCLLSLKNVIECKSDVTPVVLSKGQYSGIRGAWTLRDSPKRCKNFELLSQRHRELALCSSSCNADEIYGIQ